MAQIVVVGEILVEMMAKREGQGFSAPGEFLGPYPSGAPAIFIDQAARCGASCGIIACVGNDEFGDLNVDRLSSDGVDVSQIKRSTTHTTGTAFVAYESDGSRRFIFHFEHAAAGMLGPDDVNEDYVSQAKLVHVMGCSLSAGKWLRNAVMKAVEIAVQHQIPISFDPNFRPELFGDTEAGPAIERVLSNCTYLLTGEEEAYTITDTNSTNEALQVLRNKYNISYVVFKSGSKGATGYSRTETVHSQPIKVEQIDPTGAGDCFDGAFAACIVSGRTFTEAVAAGNVAGALSVTKQGPMEGASNWNEIVAHLGS